MSLQNLTVFQFLALCLPLAAAILALYLYDRTRLRQTVSSLRLFHFINQSSVFVRRKKIRQPWSLLLQLAALALLALSIADLRWGPSTLKPQDHILLLETSSWMNSLDRGTGERLMQEARRETLRYLATLPAADRVMLVRVDALATPTTPLTKDRDLVAGAIRSSSPGSTAMNLSAALELARNTLQTLSSSGGEVVLVGSGHVSKDQWNRLDKRGYPNLSAIWIGRENDNIGIRRLMARRSPDDPTLWQVDVGLYNYSARQRQVSIDLSFRSQPVAARKLLLAPHSSAEAGYRLPTRGVGGRLEATLHAEDDYRQDNSAFVELPALKSLTIHIFTWHPEPWKPLFEGRPYLDLQFRRPEQYNPQGPSDRLVILDGFTPPIQPDADTVAILPQPRETGNGHAKHAAPTRWNVSHPISEGVHDRDLVGTNGIVLPVSGGDTVVAESPSGPVLVASSRGPYKTVQFGFNPVDRRIRNQPAIPLLFANIVRWMSPDLLMPAEINAASPGLVEMETAPSVSREQIRVYSSSEGYLPFTLKESVLRFYVAKLGTVRVAMPDRELIYRVILPEVGESLWSSAPATRPHSATVRASGEADDLWQILAMAGALGLLIEWILYGRAHAVVSAGSNHAVNVTPDSLVTHAGRGGEVRL